MLGLYILIGVLLFLLLLILCPISLTAEYKDEKARVVLRYFFLRFVLVPQKEKKDGKEKKTKEKPDKEKSTKDTLQTLKDTAEPLLDGAKKLLSHVSIPLLRLHVAVGGDDAAKTAVECGAISAGAYTTVGLIAALTKTRRTDISILPQYNGEWNVEFYIKLRILVIFVITSLNGVIIQLIRNTINQKKDGAEK